jgi:cell division protein FtsB
MFAMNGSSSRSFWDNLLEKAFLALVSWFLFSLTQDVKTLNVSIQELNTKMAVAIRDIGDQKDSIKEMKGHIDYLQKNSVMKR